MKAAREEESDTSSDESWHKLGQNSRGQGVGRAYTYFAGGSCKKGAAYEARQEERKKNARRTQEERGERGERSFGT